MRVVFRVDSSVQMGTGHVMRCLTLAYELSKHQVHSAFICRELPGNLCDFIENRGFEVHRLPYRIFPLLEECTDPPHARWLNAKWDQDVRETTEILAERNVDWLVVDHYALDFRWEQEMRPAVKKMLVIDDLADRQHNCDLLLDQNLYENMEIRYDGLVPPECTILLGPKHALLRDEFLEARGNLRKRSGAVRRLLLFFGGSDPSNETQKALEAIESLDRPDIFIDVVVGGSNPLKENIKHFCSRMASASFYCQIDNMAELMANADLAIGAGGSATWERCFLRLPSITVVTAHNQSETTEAVNRFGAIRSLGFHESVSSIQLAEAIREALESPAALNEMVEKAAELMPTSFSEREEGLISLLLGG